MKIARKSDIYEIDKRALSEYGISTLILMENAGEAVYRVIKERENDYTKIRYLVICGKGNNGGDGFVVARKLFNDGCHVRLGIPKPIPDEGTDCAINMAIASRLGIETLAGEALMKAIGDSDIIIDAIFGIGFRDEADNETIELFRKINESKAFVISVDIPSGVYADGGAALHAIYADITVTFGLPKLGMIDFPAKAYVGEMVVAPINIPNALLKDTRLPINRITTDMVRALYRKRERDSHKGRFGHLLTIGGLEDSGGLRLTGALILSAEAALRTGVGLLTTASIQSGIQALQANLPEAMAFVLERDGSNSATLTEYIEKRRIQTVLIGNGTGTGQLAQGLLSLILENPTVRTLVLDADALNILSAHKSLLEKCAQSVKNLILTPHIGEMSRLIGWESQVIKAHKIEACQELQKRIKATVLLKDAVSVIASENEFDYNDTGSAVLAKGGSGDVLAGVVAGLVATGYGARDACIIGAYLLGRAAELYEAHYNNTSALSREIITLMALVIREIEGME